MTSRLVRTLALAAAVGAIGGIALTLTARWAEKQPGVLAVGVAATPYLAVAGVAATALALLLRARLLAVAAVAATLAVVVTQLPLYVSDAPAGEPVLRVATANVLLGRADPAQLMQLIREERLDVLALQEMPVEYADELRRRGLEDLLPHRYIVTGSGSPGSGLWSRWPLEGGRRLGGFISPNVLAEADVPGIGRVTLGSLHPAQPRPLRNGRWAGEQTRLAEELTGLAGTVVVAGDLNATPDHPLLRRLDRAGFGDAAEQAGAGLVRTWPFDKGLKTPTPLFALDHVVSRGPLTASLVRTQPLPGTDHAAVVAHLSPKR